MEKQYWLLGGGLHSDYEEEGGRSAFSEHEMRKDVFWKRRCLNSTRN